MFVDRVFGLGVAEVEMSSRGGGQMTTGGEAHDADFVGIDLKRFFLGADGSNCALGIHQGNRMLVAAIAAAIIENDCGYSK